MINENEIKYIAVEGVIGAGKTALAKKLKARLESKLILEQFEANPFLENFYMIENDLHFKLKCSF